MKILIPFILIGLFACTDHRRSPESAQVYDALQISPLQPTIKTATTQQFQVIGFAPLPVGDYNWTSDHGSITPQGVYTAPPSPGSDRVIATSKTRSSDVYVAVITVAP
ncbi:hypothetical protein [Geothrix sp. 21YS21S-4]|uniref:hypothetical protein n=1 Tax=Geothrix sp. 21YS21S-4 TaxID=3068889 RepID=UPI0027BA1F4A|nr:hypothetical protein [Geothrix sp. 21YS21S-4]